MERFIEFAYQLLQAAGSEISRLQFVHTIFNMIQVEAKADDTELFFYHDFKLYQLTWGAGGKPALRLCQENPLASMGSVWSSKAQSGEWVSGFSLSIVTTRGQHSGR